MRHLLSILVVKARELMVSRDYNKLCLVLR